MTVRIYDNARVLLGTAALNWNAHPMQAIICPANYVPNFATDKFLSNVTGSPDDVISIQVTRQSVDPTGWWKCDPIIFPTCPVGVPITQIVFYRISDTALILNINFPTLTTITPKAVVVIQSLASVGIARP